jgi:hypothetical protein
LSARASRPPVSRLVRVARFVLPFAVSGGLLAWVLHDIDFDQMLSLMTAHVARDFIPALLAFVVVSLIIEAYCLVTVVSHSRPFHDLVIAARIKAASYPLGIVNYALGAGATTVLLSRRTGMTLAEAAGAVFVIGLFDLGSLIAFVLIGVGMLGASTPGLQIGVVTAVGGLVVAGFAVLRAPMRLGAFDRIRDLAVFRDARTLPILLLARLGFLRFVFVGVFIALAFVVFEAFSVQVPAIPLIINVSLLLLVAALPIAVAGLGTGQVVFVELFQEFAPAETLIAISLTLSFGMIVTRAGIGLAVAREFTVEALAATTADGVIGEDARESVDESGREEA